MANDISCDECAAMRHGARLLADIGGTNARFAWQAGPGAAIEAPRTLACANFPSIAAAIRRYLDDTGRAAPRLCAIAIANPVTGDGVQMTNHHWSFSIVALKAHFGFAHLRVLNDFTALALALPALGREEVRQVGSGKPIAERAIGLIGPGTGLGVSGLLPDGCGGWIPLQGEGGHVTLAARTSREQAVLDHLDRWYGHASAERAVSGRGLVDILRALHAIDGARGDAAAGVESDFTHITGADITAGALAGADARSAEALSLFCAFLGTAAGNLALTLGAHGGIYIGGGIVPRLGTWFDQSPFRARFEAKGRFSAYLTGIPTFVIQAVHSPALTGAACALDAAIAAPPDSSPIESSVFD